MPFTRHYWNACRVAWINPRSRIYDAMMQMQVGHHMYPDNQQLKIGHYVHSYLKRRSAGADHLRQKSTSAAAAVGIQGTHSQ